MKNIIKYFVLTILLIIPTCVNALAFSCETGSYKYDESFKCTLTGNGNKHYKQILATLDDHDYIACSPTEYARGLSESKDKKNIKSDGTPAVEGDIPLITFTCRVNIKTSSDMETQIVLRNVQYEIDGEGPISDPEILRSETINLEQYVNENTTTTTSDTKPRDISNGNSLLKKLGDPKLDKYFTFSKFVTKYNFEVLFELDEINLEYETNVEDARVEIIGNQKLEVGENVIDVYVTSPDLLSQTCYTLTITRLPSGQEIYYPEKDATLKKLEIKYHPIKFESVIKEYRIKIGSDENELIINTAPTVQGANYIIEGNKELKNGNVITITVTSKDNTVVEKYAITIQKEKEKKDYSNYYYLGIIGFVLLIVIIFVVKSSNKRNSDVEKQMSKYAKIFKKNKKEPDATQVQPVQPIQQSVQPVPQVQPVAPVQQGVQPVPQVQPVAPVQQPVQPVAVAQPSQQDNNTQV